LRWELTTIENWTVTFRGLEGWTSPWHEVVVVGGKLGWQEEAWEEGVGAHAERR
jgi:hypothetical protein